MKLGTVITLKYLGPTNHNGSRISVKTLSGKRKTYSWAYELGESDNYKKAAVQFIQSMEWDYKDLVFTSTNDGAIVTLVF